MHRDRPREVIYAKKKRVFRDTQRTTRPVTGTFMWLLITAWTVVVLCALAWGLYTIRNNGLAITRDQARAMYTNIVTFRKWNAKHGGVYAPISGANKPNEFLASEPERDVVTESGKELTLINPAYMTRQVEALMDEEEDLSYRAHLTSLKTINPNNKPDRWATAALKKLVKGETNEVSSLQTLDGEQYMRVMFPLVRTEHCIKCHCEKKLGTKIGEIRGGISVSVPMAFVAPVTKRDTIIFVVGCIFVWALGLLTLLIGGRKQIETELSLRDSEERLHDAQKIAHLGSWEWDIVSNKLHWSDETYRIFGLAKDEFPATYDAFLETVHPEDREMVEKAVFGALAGKPYKLDHRIGLPNGAVRVVQEIGEMFWDDKDRPVTMIGTVLDITERRKAEEKIEFMAYHDELSGLPNRRWLEKRFDEIKRAGRGAAVMYIELTEYKNIKNTLGSDVANQMVSYLSTELPENGSPGRSMSRIGDDEFIVVLENTGLRSVSSYAGELLDFFRQPVPINKNQITAVANIGISLFPQDGKDIETVLHCAETAASYSKKLGPYHYSFFGEKMGSFKYKAKQQIIIASSLSEALEQKKFVMHYQPIVDMANENIVGVEALIRRVTSGGELIMPAEFICVAEKTGQIIPINDWVLNDVCAQAGKWGSAGYGKLMFSINIPAAQFTEPGLVPKLKALFDQLDINPSQFLMEITENEIMRNPKLSIETMEHIRDMGVKVAVDDFGTGYSSLSYLKKLPVDVIKIDKVFVADINFNSEGRAIVKAVTEIAHALDMTVIAEGVETIEQKNLLKNLGCDLAQGFIFNKPLPVEQVEQLLKQARGEDSGAVSGQPRSVKDLTK